MVLHRRMDDRVDCGCVHRVEPAMKTIYSLANYTDIEVEEGSTTVITGLIKDRPELGRRTLLIVDEPDGYVGTFVELTGMAIPVREENG